MYSIRKWFYKPKKDDSCVLAQFFYADEELNLVAAELDSFDGRKDPERCTVLVNQLRQCQDKVLNICNQIMEEVIPGQRAIRDFRVKFPDDVLQENLAGQLWFGAECLAAGSSILNREVESASMRPLAKRLTKMLDNVRTLLREQSLRNPHIYSSKIKEALTDFDCLFAEFELCYVSAMVPVKSMKEYDLQQDLVVLFSETLHRALQFGLLSQDSVDYYDPALMFTIPRLAIVCGLLVFPDGPLNVDGDPKEVSEMFRPFQNLLHKIRDLLWTLSQAELFALEKTLCSVEDTAIMNWETEGDAGTGSSSVLPSNGGSDGSSGSGGGSGSVGNAGGYVLPDVDDYLLKLYQDYPSCKQFINDLCTFVVAPRAAEATTTDDGTTDDNDVIVVGMETNDDARSGGEGISSECTHCRQSGSSDNNGGDGLHHRRTEKSGGGKQRSPARRTKETEVPLSRRVLRPDAAAATLNLASPASRNSLGTTSAAGSPSNWDSVSCYSTDTSSYNSECQDDEEIALAVQAAEIATRQGARSRFKDVRDLIHRLFVCIAGVADQLQTNYASDLRNILKCVFEMNCSQSPDDETTTITTTSSACHFFGPGMGGGVGGGGSGGGGGQTDLAEERVSIESAEEANERDARSSCEEAPSWIPDQLAPQCMSCEAPFNLVRRRHHCRNCGKVFCGRCSSNSVPLPRYGLTKPVRVCNRCFMFQVTPFMIAPPQPVRSSLVD